MLVLHKKKQVGDTRVATNIVNLQISANLHNAQVNIMYSLIKTYLLMQVLILIIDLS